MIKSRNKKKNIMFWLMAMVGMIYGAFFGYFVGKYIYPTTISLFILLFTILGFLIAIGFTLAAKK